MYAFTRSCLRPLALGVALATCIPACQHMDLPAGHSLLATGDTQWTKLSSSQAADMKVAEGRAFEDRGDLARAAAAYQEALKADAGRADAYIRLARIRDGQGQFRESQELYEKALKAAPGNADICCDMGYSLYLQRRWQEAETCLRQAVALQPGHQRAHTNLALVLAHQDRDRDALAEFRRAGCSEAEAHANLGFVRMVQGSWSDAQEEYRHALALDSGCKAAHKGLAQLTAVVQKAGKPNTAPPASESQVTMGAPEPLYTTSPSPRVATSVSPYAPVYPVTEANPGVWMQTAAARRAESAGEQ